MRFEWMQEGAVWNSSCGYQHQKWGHILPQAHHHVQQGRQFVASCKLAIFGWQDHGSLANHAKNMQLLMVIRLYWPMNVMSRLQQLATQVS